ncbi:hypothetical protein BDM02DRAFT_499814 [Thelephora ganbajun]|uniref:Uncharacterized protein n=1 Tax=Thelephora ganbajun TaxID=370292 RepID=A0ACB6Z7P7_THEGA|nr:hypothetical protein BDM02DRAFT_499814 [Thelephora ganbajun]
MSFFYRKSRSHQTRRSNPSTSRPTLSYILYASQKLASLPLFLFHLLVWTLGYTIVSLFSSLRTALTRSSCDETNILYNYSTYLGPFSSVVNGWQFESSTLRMRIAVTPYDDSTTTTRYRMQVVTRPGLHCPYWSQYSEFKLAVERNSCCGITC